MPMRLIAVLGGILLLAGAGSTLFSPLWWWPLIMTGGFLVAGACNAGRSASSLFHLAGTARARLRWVYAGVYNQTPGVAFLILFGYPVFLAFLHERFVLARRILHHPLRALLFTFAVALIFNELPNALALLWTIPPGNEQVVRLLFYAGYLAEIAVAVAPAALLGSRRVPPRHLA